MTARGAANALTRTTAILAAVFFVTSLGLSIIARYSERPTDILNRVPQQSEQNQGNLLDQLGGAVTKPAADAPAGQAPAAAPGAVPTETAPAIPGTPVTPLTPAAPTGVPTGQ